MKRVMLNFVVIVVFITSNISTAQEIVDTSKTSTKTIRTSSEKEIKEIVYKGITYYIFNSTWHTKMKNRYVLRNPPKGAKIDFRPDGGKYVTMHGRKYYRCKGIFYKELKDSIYEVVRI